MPHHLMLRADGVFIGPELNQAFVKEIVEPAGGFLVVNGVVKAIQLADPGQILLRQLLS